jgi:hypothetical protein
VLTYTFDGPHVVVTFDYHPPLVAALKQAIPRSYRRWAPDRRAWLIGREFWPIAREIFASFGLSPREELQTPEPWRILHLQPGAPPEVVDAVYRTLAKLHHPDVGGSNDRMREINLAYERLTGASDGR